MKTIKRKLNPEQTIDTVVALQEVWPDAEFEKLALCLDELEGITIEIKSNNDLQTSKQWGYYWASLRPFAKWLGDSPRGLHEDLMLEAGLVEVRETKRGPKFRRKSLSELSKQETSELIETMIRAGEFNQYHIPPPRLNYDYD